jgi:hypothetical protein
MLLKLLFSYFFLTTNSLPQNAVSLFKVSSCSTANDLMKNVVLSVDPILPQTDYTLFLSGDLTQEVNDGTSEYSVTYNFIPLTPTIEVLCDEIAKSNITCPLKIGHVASQSKGTIPLGLSGTTNIKNQWFNIKKERILCMQFKIIL